MCHRTTSVLLAVALTLCAAFSRESGANPRQSLQKDSKITAPLRRSSRPCVDAAAGATWATQDCVDAELDFQNARLNRIYGRLIKILPEQQSDRLRARQRDWLVRRERSCPWEDDTEGQGQRLESNYCSMEMTAVRAAELEGMMDDLKDAAP